MHLDQLRSFCLSFEGAEEALPFGPDVLAFKILGKLFLLVPLDKTPLQCNVKCDPEKALELRERYSAVLPGYHMNKKHWNTIIMDGSIPGEVIRQQIIDSYQLVKGNKV